MVPGVAGLEVYAVTDLQNEALWPHALTARTHKLPVLYVVEKLKVILLVVDVPVAPLGNVQVYDVAPLIAGVLNTCPVEFLQTPAGPEMDAGAAGPVELELPTV